MVWRRARVEAIGSAATIIEPTGPAGEGPEDAPGRPDGPLIVALVAVRIVCGIGCEPERLCQRRRYV
jgi:hypothetical protein